MSPFLLAGMSATLPCSGSSVLTTNCSPAPSQSAAVISGVCTYTKPSLLKNCVYERI
jgi:hypothetical protein